MENKMLQGNSELVGLYFALVDKDAMRDGQVKIEVFRVYEVNLLTEKMYSQQIREDSVINVLCEDFDDRFLFKEKDEAVAWVNKRMEEHKKKKGKNRSTGKHENMFNLLKDLKEMRRHS